MGFLSELQLAGLSPTWVCNKHYNVESGREAAEEWLRLTERPTAVFCSCDEAAFGFIAALRRKEIRVPENVSVVGFDDIPLADHYCPALTTVRQPHRELGTIAVRMLLERIRDVEASIPNQLLEGKLIVRKAQDTHQSLRPLIQDTNTFNQAFFTATSSLASTPQTIRWTTRRTQYRELCKWRKHCYL